MKNNYKFIAAAIAALIILRSLTRKKGFKNKAAQLANEELNAWSNGSTKEGNASTLQRLRDYWKQGAKVNASDSYYINNAWSGAFISYIMRKAGAGDQFPYNALHANYINKAKQNRKNNIKSFQAFKKSEVPVTVGDLICYPRQEGITYESNGTYFAHCDIVTEVTPGKAYAIGGNVSDSVKKSAYNLDSNNKVTTEKVHAIIKTLI
jgi:hypothetical protein